MGEWFTLAARTTLPLRTMASSSIVSTTQSVERAEGIDCMVTPVGLEREAPLPDGVGVVSGLP